MKTRLVFTFGIWDFPVVIKPNLDEDILNCCSKGLESSEVSPIASYQYSCLFMPF
jgi:hypothetical protein